MTDFAEVAVLGFGTMGRGIAQVVAASGREVKVLEADEHRIADGTVLLRDFLDDGVRRGKLEDADKHTILGRIEGVTDVEALRGSALVIEAIGESYEAKAALLPRIAEVACDDAVVVTNTSALSVTALASVVPRPERFAGLHFFNPAPLMRIVEVVRGLQTAPEVVARLESLCRDLGKDPVVVPDRPGFLVNRLLIPYLNDVIQAYDDGLASAEDIDLAIELGLGHRMGPLRLLDVIGLDVHHHASEQAFQQLQDARFAPPPLLSRMVEAGRLGTKSGRGFVTRDDDGLASGGSE